MEVTIGQSRYAWHSIASPLTREVEEASDCLNLTALWSGSAHIFRLQYIQHRPTSSDCTTFEISPHFWTALSPRSAHARGWKCTYPIRKSGGDSLRRTLPLQWHITALAAFCLGSECHLLLLYCVVLERHHVVSQAAACCLQALTLLVLCVLLNPRNSCHTVHVVGSILCVASQMLNCSWLLHAEVLLISLSARFSPLLVFSKVKSCRVVSEWSQASAFS